MREHLVPQPLHRALRHDDHDAEVGVVAHDARKVNAAHRAERADKAAPIGVGLPDERGDEPIDEDAEEHRPAHRGKRGDDDEHAGKEEFALVVDEEIAHEAREDLFAVGVQPCGRAPACHVIRHRHDRHLLSSAIRRCCGKFRCSSRALRACRSPRRAPRPKRGYGRRPARS